MIRLALVLLALLPTTCLAAKSTAAENQRLLDFRTISLNGDQGGMLAVVDGQPRLVNSRSAWTEWTLRESDKGWTIQGRRSRENHELRFLGVDAEGKISGLFSIPLPPAYAPRRTNEIPAGLAVSRGQSAKLLVNAFALELYGS